MFRTFIVLRSLMSPHGAQHRPNMGPKRATKTAQMGVSDWAGVSFFRLRCWKALEDRFGAHLGASWGSSWALLAPSWALLGPSWALLAPSWALLGPSWGPLGALLRPSWGQKFTPRGCHEEGPRVTTPAFHLEVVLSPSWVILGPSWAILAHLGPILELPFSFRFSFTLLCSPLLCLPLLCFTLSSASLPRPGGMRDAFQ